jgi:hypothetical protein
MILISLIIIVSVLVMFTVRRNQRKLIIENFITRRLCDRPPRRDSRATGAPGRGEEELCGKKLLILNRAFRTPTVTLAPSTVLVSPAIGIARLERADKARQRVAARGIW